MTNPFGEPGDLDAMIEPTAKIMVNAFAGDTISRLQDGTFIVSPNTLEKLREMTKSDPFADLLPPVDPRPLVEEWPCEGVRVCLFRDTSGFLVVVYGGPLDMEGCWRESEDAARLAVVRWCAACAYLAPRHEEWMRALEIAKKMGQGESEVAT